MSIQSINPWTGDPITEHKADTEKELNQKLSQADTAYQNWRKLSFEKRALKLQGVANQLEKEKEDLSLLMTREMGKPIQQAKAEIDKCAWVCRYYAEHAADFLADEKKDSDASKSFVRHNPMGVILGIMPWNFPFWQFFRFAAPTLMAGNTVLLKHASSVMGCAKAIESLFQKADCPPFIAQSLIVSASAVEKILDHQAVQAVSLTGSGPAGSAVASQAGKRIKKSLLELGGTNAFIVFDDADHDLAVEKAVWARFQNTGQSCIAGKRFLIQESVYDTFKDQFVEKVKALEFGDPEKKSTKIGPMASENLAEELEAQLQKSLEQGANLLMGGKRTKARFEPTVIEGVRPGMPAFDEELFGPVASLATFQSEEEAVQLSNRSDFGLGVSICTKDENRMHRLIDQMEEGAIFFNELVKSDPRLPFGGVKNSGYGRELSRAGILEFVNQKTVYFA